MLNCKSILSIIYVLMAVNTAIAQKTEISLGRVKAEVTTNTAGELFYTVSFDGKPVIKKSAMGFKLKGNDTSFRKGFAITGTSIKETDEAWKPVWGEVAIIRDHHKELMVHLRQTSAPHYLMNVVFRVFADGVGFRYEFPEQPDLDFFVLSDEVTQFNLAGDHKTFWIPGDYDSNEYAYTTSKISEIDNKPVVAKEQSFVIQNVADRYSVQTPLMMKTADGLYLNIHEAALIDFPAMQLHVNRDQLALTASLVPDAVGNKAYLHAPFKTPWRTIVVSDKAIDILASKLILNLNAPAKNENTAWIKPMKFIGVWWEMQTKKSTWSFANSVKDLDAKGNLIPNGKHGANTANVKRYIDFAAENKIDGVLVEGWNVGWEDWFGNWKENVFDFITPYPDFDIKTLTAYARGKGVKLLMHNETSGSATNYERQIDTAFRFMKKFGYGAVKTGYVGRIIPRGEHHDGQWMVNHYQRVLQKGLQYQIAIDAHEMVRPTGLHRTYPNFLASEAARGMEFNAFSEGNAPEHETILPFTRLMGGPMDYTPGIFKLKNFSGDSTKRVRSTLCKQLALYVTLYSPLQMAADLPENYRLHADAFRFIRDVPVDWDDTKIVEAEPGDYVTIARKEKGKPNWFVGAITNQNGRSASIPLSFLDKGRKYKLTVYSDAPDAHFNTNPGAYVIQNKILTSGDSLTIKLAPGGGCAVSITPIN